MSNVSMLPSTPCHDGCSRRPATPCRPGACSQISGLKVVSQRRHARQRPLQRFWANRHLAKCTSAEASLDAYETDAQEQSSQRFDQISGAASTASPGGKTLEANDYKLADIFSNHVFRLFKAQRPYMWKEDLALKLLEDFITQVVEDGSKSVSELGVFSLGMMNVCEVSVGSRTVLEILDGQQRLVTICLIFAAIRKKLLDHGHTSYVKTISDRLWQPAKDDEDLPAQPRLELKRFDVAFFNEILKEPAAIEGINDLSSSPTLTQEHIRDNLQAIKRRLDDCTVEQCIAVNKYIVLRTHIIVARYRDTQAALQVYRTGNMTSGMKLAAMDLLKADVLDQVRPEDQQYVSDDWEKLEQQETREKMAKLFQNLVIISLQRRHSENTEPDDLNKMFLASWRRHSEKHRGHASITTAGMWFTEDFLPCYARASAYLEAYKLPGISNHREVESEVEYYLKLLYRLPEHIRDGWMPAALGLAAECGACNSTVKLDVLIGLERLAWYLILRGANINAIHARFCRVTASLRKQGADGSLKDAKGVDGLELSDAEKLDMRQKLDGPVYNLKCGGKAVIKPLLARLNEFVLNRNDQPYVKYDIQTLTTEHILPQNVKRGSGWERDFPDEDLRKHWVHRMGNLMLLSGRKNSGASDHDFEHKKNYYLSKKIGAQAHVNNIPLTDEVANLDTWTIAELEKRQIKHVNYAAQSWKLY